MSDRCNVDRPGESCATVLTEERAATDSRCADCETEGRPVDHQTILHHVKHGHLNRVNGEAYRFCADEDCEVVYYGDGGTRFTVDDLRELVTAKTKGDARPICYCFGFTEGDARREIELTGCSSIPTTISKLIKEGMCACEVRNPAGVCCLGQVNQVVKRVSAECKASIESPSNHESIAAPAHDCCAR